MRTWSILTLRFEQGTISEVQRDLAQGGWGITSWRLLPSLFPEQGGCPGVSTAQLSTKLLLPPALAQPGLCPWGLASTDGHRLQCPPSTGTQGSLAPQHGRDSCDSSAPCQSTDVTRDCAWQELLPGKGGQGAAEHGSGYTGDVQCDTRHSWVPGSGSSIKTTPCELPWICDQIPRNSCFNFVFYSLFSILSFLPHSIPVSLSSYCLSHALICGF